jgi:hypothetical protein
MKSEAGISTQEGVDDPRLDLVTPLTPGNAVAAILIVGGRISCNCAIASAAFSFRRTGVASAAQ